MGVQLELERSDSLLKNCSHWVPYRWPATKASTGCRKDGRPVTSITYSWAPRTWCHRHERPEPPEQLASTTKSTVLPYCRINEKTICTAGTGSLLSPSAFGNRDHHTARPRPKTDVLGTRSRREKKLTHPSGIHRCTRNNVAGMGGTTVPKNIRISQPRTSFLFMFLWIGARQPFHGNEQTIYPDTTAPWRHTTRTQQQTSAPIARGH